MLSEAEYMLAVSKKSLEQRAQDLDQYRQGARSPKSESGVGQNQEIHPSMSEIAAKVLSVLHERHMGSERDTDSLDGAQSVVDSITDDERSLSSKDTSHVGNHDESLTPNVVKGGNLLKKSGLRG